MSAIDVKQVCIQQLDNGAHFSHPCRQFSTLTSVSGTLPTEIGTMQNLLNLSVNFKFFIFGCIIFIFIFYFYFYFFVPLFIYTGPARIIYYFFKLY